MSERRTTIRKGSIKSRSHESNDEDGGRMTSITTHWAGTASNTNVSRIRRLNGGTKLSYAKGHDGEYEAKSCDAGDATNSISETNASEA